MDMARLAEQKGSRGAWQREDIPDFYRQ